MVWSVGTDCRSGDEPQQRKIAEAMLIALVICTGGHEVAVGDEVMTYGRKDWWTTWAGCWSRLSPCSLPDEDAPGTEAHPR